MIDFQEAKEKVLSYANKNLGENSQIEYIFDKDGVVINRKTLWYIPLIEKLPEDRMSGGFGQPLRGCIIDKLTGEICTPYTKWDTLETWIWGFEIGLRDGQMDLTITKINDEKLTLKIVEELRINYVIPELAAGIIWKIPKLYTLKELEMKISKLPCTFRNQYLIGYFSTFYKLMENRAFEFEINSSKNIYEGISGELIDKDNLIK